jgi:hypothetical protein
MKTDFHKKYEDLITGTISCYDRLLISGTLPRWGYADAMTAYMVQERIPFISYTYFAESINQQIRQRMEFISAADGMSIQNIKKPRTFNKEKEVQKILLKRGMAEGIVKIFSVMEGCDGYEYRWDAVTKRGKMISRSSKCIHYYIYFIDKYLGLGFMRIPTWLPCRVEVYCNGHNLLATKLKKAGIGFTMHDNAFTGIDDYEKAQELSNDIRAKDFHTWLDVFAQRYIPFLEESQQSYKWTINQAEYATDIIFKQPEDLKMIYEELILRSIHTVKPENIATFFSRALAAHFSGEVTTRYNKQIHGTRVKHNLGANSVKMYDKAPGVLRIETTINKVSEFKIFREVVTRKGERKKQFAAMPKSIYSLYDLSKECFSVNSRYLDFLASFDDNSIGKRDISKVTMPVYNDNRSYRGFNFFDPFDEEVLIALSSGEFNIHGLRNKHLRQKLSKPISAATVSRILKRLFKHGLIKKVANTFKYYVTKFGRKVIACALSTKQFHIIPAMALKTI